MKTLAHGVATVAFVVVVAPLYLLVHVTEASAPEPCYGPAAEPAPCAPLTVEYPPPGCESPPPRLPPSYYPGWERGR